MSVTFHKTEDHVPVLPNGVQSGSAVSIFSGLDELTPAFTHLFEVAGRENFFLASEWFRNFIRNVLAPDDCVRIYGVAPASDLSIATGMLLAQSLRRSGWISGRILTSLTNYYSCLFGPITVSEPADRKEGLRAMTEYIASEKPGWDLIDLHPLDPGSEAYPEMVDALRSAGFVVQTYFCFGNWYLPVEQRSFAQYLDGRPSILRNTLARKRKKLEKSGRARIEIVAGVEHLDDAIESYTRIYQASWKQPEPYPHFIPGLIRTCAEMGALRLGLVYIDEQPAAAQLWVVHGGAALIYKLAYDERFSEYSAGTVLTAALMEHVMDVDRVEVIDYLSGDDGYKKDWMSHRRERWGVLAMNPRTVRGALAIARNVGGRFAARAARRLWTAFRKENGE